MIKPVTYQGAFNFKANLYALEVASRFIDHTKANGYYKNYGSELNATIVGNTIQIGTGAFVVQGRMNEVTSTETVTLQLFNNFVGYVVARIETYHPTDEFNCSFKAIINQSFEEITLVQQNTFAADAENTNKVYELPIYSFEITNGTITNLQKLIEPCGDYEKLKAIVDDALLKAESAVTTANSADDKATNALSNSQSAIETVETKVDEVDVALETINQQITTVNSIIETSNEKIEQIETFESNIQSTVDELAEQIGEQQGTTVTINDIAQATIPFQGTVTADKIVLLFDGGGS